MILYIDTSALVKKYAVEEDSKGFIKVYNNAEAIAISKVGYAETLAAFYKKLREKTVSTKELNLMIRFFKNDWKSFISINTVDSVIDEIETLIAKYGLRGFDAIHLASAIVLKKSLKENITFVCYDELLLTAAKKEHFLIYPETASLQNKK